MHISSLPPLPSLPSSYPPRSSQSARLGFLCYLAVSHCFICDSVYEPVLLFQFIPHLPSSTVSTSPFFTRFISPFFSRFHIVVVQSFSCVWLFAIAWTAAHLKPCLLSQRCHPTISSSVITFSSCLLPFPASGSFPMSQFFASGGQSIGASSSASVLPMNIQIPYIYMC